MPDAPTYEDNIPFIDAEIAKRKNLWNLSSIAWMDWDDVAQLIRIHIYEKWHLYNPKRPLGPWLNKVISHRFKNIVRNLWGNHVRPCLRCAAAEGENLCKIYTTQCNACPLFAAWEKSKKKAYDVKFALPIEHYLNEEEISYHDEQNIDSIALAIHKRMEVLLKPSEWVVYKLLFIDHVPEEEVAVRMGYKSNENGRRPGYKQIRNIRKAIMDKVKKALRNDEIDIL